MLKNLLSPPLPLQKICQICSINNVLLKLLTIFPGDIVQEIKSFIHFSIEIYCYSETKHNYPCKIHALILKQTKDAEFFILNSMCANGENYADYWQRTSIYDYQTKSSSLPLIILKYPQLRVPHIIKNYIFKLYNLTSKGKKTFLKLMN